MDIKTYLLSTGTSQSSFAKDIGVTQGMIWQWLKGLRPISAEQCVSIENHTESAVTRQELRPTDWHLIWPELVSKEAA